MRILFIHNNFPGQYQRIVTHLKPKTQYQLLSATLASNRQPSPVRRVTYAKHRRAGDQTHPALRYTEDAVITGQGVLKACLPLKQRGFSPDIVLAHSGFGSSMFVKDLWPDAKFLPYFEWYYRPDGGDFAFLSKKEADINQLMAIRLKNTPFLHDFAAMDWGQCPTEYQASRFPDSFRKRITVLHDGVDTDFFAPDDSAVLEVGNKKFTKGDPVVTYIARGMEPHRGFPQFIEAISILQQMHDDVHTVIIGTDRIAYGARRKDGRGLKEEMLARYPLDMSRTHFTGPRPLAFLRDALRVSSAHVYLTVPFVLSWSMLEAMSAGALIVGSDTPPVTEVIEDGRNGVLVPFLEPKRLAQTLNEAVTDPLRFDPLRHAARRTILERYDARVAVAEYEKLINAVAEGQLR